MPSQWLAWVWDESCPYGIGKKFKNCCGAARDAAPPDATALH